MRSEGNEIGNEIQRWIARKEKNHSKEIVSGKGIDMHKWIPMRKMKY
jgi:hypothetical protein